MSATVASPSLFGRFGRPLDVDPSTSPADRIRDLAAVGRTADAALLKKIASSPRASWFGDWNSNVAADVSAVVRAASQRRSVATVVAYNIPNRDCGTGYLSGAKSDAAYRTWVDAFARGLGTTRSVVILEPDALAQLDCLSAARKEERLNLVSYAVWRIGKQGSFVYVDAGNSAWRSSSTMAARLKRVGVSKAAGFSLNVSNFQSTAKETAYGTAISKAIGPGARFVIDTSRNGVQVESAEWCNPRGRGLGARPTTATTSALVDAYLWVKRPGESDGTCNGGPEAGTFWPEYALELARNALKTP